jgi:hypothetical protein
MVTSLCRDVGAARLWGLAKKTKDGPQARRLLALLAITYAPQLSLLLVR